MCDSICDCVNLNNRGVCEDELDCEKIYKRESHFLNCTDLSLRCPAPKLDNSIWTGGLAHTEKCVKVEFLCNGNAECLSSGFGLSWPRPLDELGCKSTQGANSKSIPGKTRM